MDLWIPLREWQWLVTIVPPISSTTPTIASISAFVNCVESMPSHSLRTPPLPCGSERPRGQPSVQAGAR